MKERECNEILKKLKSEDPSEIREGCFLVGEERCTEGIQILVELLKSNNVGIQEAAELSLRKIGGEASVEALIPLLWEEDAGVRNTAIDILREIGEQGLDLIIDLLDDKEPDIRIFAVDILGYCTNVLVINILCDVLQNDPDPNVRSQAAIGLGNMGYVEAIPCLERALEDEEWVKFSVIESLKKIGKDTSTEVLINYLGKGSDLIDSAIIDALASMGKVRIVPILLNKLDTDNIALRNKIIQALVILLGEKTLAILNDTQLEKFKKYLVEALSDDDEDVRDAALKGLAFVKDKASSKEIFEFALNLDEETDEDLLNKAIEVLKSIGTTDFLLDAVRSDNEKKSLFAIRLLCEFEDKKALETLTEVFWSQDRDIQREIVDALSKKDNPFLKDFFINILKKHDDGKVIKAALRFLGEKLRCEESQEEIFRFLDHPYDDVKEVALNSLVAIGSEWVKEKFIQMHKSNDPLKRFMAVYAFGIMGCGDFKQYVKESLNDEHEDIRKLAIEAYAHCSNGDTVEDELIEILNTKIDDPSKEVRLAVINVLFDIQDKNKLKPLITKILKDPDDFVKMRALDLCADVFSDEEIFELLPILNSNNQMLKIKGIEVLGRIGGKIATQHLLKILNKDKDPEIQELVEKILIRDKE